MRGSVHLLDPQVAAAFYGRFESLREAQQAAIEPILAGRNVILSSGTGSGKTEAVMAPLMNRLWRDAVKTDALVLLYIAPTKALVNDLEKRLYRPLYALGLRAGIRHGDRDDLASGKRVHVLVTTPESFDVMLFRKDAALGSLRAVVIDEVHLLYNTQRGLQLSILLQRLRDRLGKPFQWAALSATIGDLSDVHGFLAGSDESPVFLSFPSHRPIDAHIRHVATETQFLDLVRKLTSGRPTKLLVFANSRRECERLAGTLQQDTALRHSVFAHYSSLSSEVRLETERKFADSDNAICLATSTLELGIDIGDIDAVLLWGVPGCVESFLQRIGRGNRRAHKTNAVCLIPDTCKSVGWDALCFASLVDAASKGELPRRCPYELYGAVAQQMLSIIASDGGRFTRVADLCKLVRHKVYLDRPTVESILAQLAANGYLQAHGFKNQYGADEMLHELVDFRMIYGNYGSGSQTVDLYHGAKCLGEIPATNLLRIHRGSVVRFNGKCWRVQKASRDKILLEPVRSGDAIDFTYAGARARIDAFVANRVWQLLHAEGFPESLFALSLRSTVLEARARLRSVCTFNQIPYVRSVDGFQYFTFAGYLVNKAVGLISGNKSFKASDASVLVPSPIDWGMIPSEPQAYESVFPSLFEMSSEQSLYQALLPPELQLREYLEDWLKDQAVTDVLRRLVSSSPVAINSGCIGFFASAD
ncbi:MAG TPA: DEAD/DEAH box helicase [Candidatus Hydrogenedentes bacterium]|nr:DEAD/DEAH box helicase [Candidatus Hydrogenedentota bacterium]